MTQRTDNSTTIPEPAAAPSERAVRLRGVRVHNLKNIDVDIPLHRLTVVTGVSGSGKSSLAFDTLYAEGQRRYIECFSAYARQFLDRLQKPDADRIEAIPPAIAIRQHSVNLSSRATVGTSTEIHDYLRLLFARIGHVVCPACDIDVQHHSSTDILDAIRRFDDGTRYQIAFSPPKPDRDVDVTDQLREEGFTRVVIDGSTKTLADSTQVSGVVDYVIVDRLSAGRSAEERIVDSLETALRAGDGTCVLMESPSAESDRSGSLITVDGDDWCVHRFSERLVCSGCGEEFQLPEPRLFSFNTPLGACPECEGFGSVPAISFEKLVPDPSKTLREGAIAAWTTPAYQHELDELLALADDYDVPVDVPFRELQSQHLDLIRNGVPERDFGGLAGFFRWLERNRYKTGVRVFLSRWRAYQPCPGCGGSRLRIAALAVRIAGADIADVCARTIDEAIAFFDAVSNRPSPRRREGQEGGQDDAPCAATTPILNEICSRLRYLQSVGLGYLTLDRTMRTLSGGEAQRVALTSALGSSLVNTLYVLDEPTTGLHPIDTRRVISQVRQLRDVGNTVVVVEHDEEFVRAANQIVELGPGAGRSGGEVVFRGTPDELEADESAATGEWLRRARDVESTTSLPPRPSPAGGEPGRRAAMGAVRIRGVRHHNLKNVSVEIPLGVLCVITGVSGSGKSSLVHETLYPALCAAMRRSSGVETPGEFDSIDGVEQIRDVIMIDQQSIGRSQRSVPITYLKAFDDIRRVFAETVTAKLRNFTPSMFSFNSAQGGRCPKCEGNGAITIDMQFLADVSMICPECGGTRFRSEVLECKYRGLTISDVLGMSVDESFSFFRAQPRLQRKLKFLKDVGLGYLPLGQPTPELSGGESQRLKLAAHMAGVVKTSGENQNAPTGAGTLFLFDEPTSGLHAADVSTLLECFGTLLDVGHSLIVIEHNLQVIRAADHIIDLGPGAGDQGGAVVACGTPDDIRDVDESATGAALRGEAPLCTPPACE